MSMPTDDAVMQNAERYVRQCFALSGFENVTPQEREEVLMKIYRVGIKLRDASFANAEHRKESA